MKASKDWLGKVAEVVWLDPTGGRVKSRDLANHSDVPRGKKALAKWRTYGVVDDITEGVVRLVNGFGTDESAIDDAFSDEYDGNWIPESLIESIRVFQVTAPVDGEKE